MPQFYYKAKEGPTKIVEGAIEADNRDVAIAKVMQRGLSPLDVMLSDDVPITKPAKKSKRVSFSFVKRVTLNDVVQFTREMSDLIEAAVPVLRALHIVAGQTENVAFRKIVEEIHLFVKDGGAFSAALAQHPKTFSPLFVNLVKTGEVSGRLETVLKRLADYLEKEQETRSKVRSSLAYPSLILVVGMLTIFVLMAFVVPRLTVMFDDLGQELPWPTLVLTQVGDFFSYAWWVVLALVGVSVYYFNRWVQTDTGRYWLDGLMLRIPVVGEFLRIVEVGRFSRTLGTLVETGVVITTALHSVWATIENAVLRNEVKDVSDQVANGLSLRRALQGVSFFPEMAVNMISVGEETGSLEKSLYKIADTYERQADQKIKTLVSLVGPLALIFIVCIVGFVVIAMLLPIFQMNLIIE